MDIIDILGIGGLVLALIAAYTKFRRPHTSRLDLPPEFRPPQTPDPEQIRITMLRNLN